MAHWGSLRFDLLRDVVFQELQDNQTYILPIKAIIQMGVRAVILPKHLHPYKRPLFQRSPSVHCWHHGHIYVLTMYYTDWIIFLRALPFHRIQSIMKRDTASLNCHDIIYVSTEAGNPYLFPLSHLPCFFSNRSRSFGWCIVVQLVEDIVQDPSQWTWSEDVVLVSESIVEDFHSVRPHEESALCSLVLFCDCLNHG